LQGQLNFSREGNLLSKRDFVNKTSASWYCSGKIHTLETTDITGLELHVRFYESGKIRAISQSLSDEPADTSYLYYENGFLEEKIINNK